MVTEINKNTSATIGTDAVIVSDAVNTSVSERKVITFINSSTGGQIITLSVGDMSANNKGIPLNPGGYYSESKDAGFTPTQTHITAISNAAGGTLSIQERLLVR